MKNEDIMVSINCITYNHGKYIEKAIESFLMQKTNFNFEILIHDDASTDKTQEIIKKYESMYPNIIKPILQKENQYSKGIRRIGHVFNDRRAKGRYIACCDGDDYWIDPYKLQKQVDYMEKNKECSMCFHAADILDEDRKYISNTYRAYDSNCIARIEDIIFEGGGFCPTASILYRRKLIENLPEFYFEAHVGDYPIQIIMASKGTVYYINDSMSVYRTNVKDSWTDKEYHNIDFDKKMEKLIKNYKKDIKLLSDFNDYTNNKYLAAIEKKILSCKFNLDIINGNIKSLKKDKYIEFYRMLKIKDKIKIYTRSYFPNLYVSLYKIKRRVK